MASDITKKGKQIGVVKDLERPWSLTVDSEGYIYVIESEKDCITKCTRAGEKITSFGERGVKKGQFMSPLGVAITKNEQHILIVDQLRLQVFDLNGKFVKCTSTRNLALKKGFAVAVHPITNQIYIADGENHIIAVANEDMKLEFTFGKCGSKEGELNKPRDIAINSQGMVYVADYNNDRICKFTSTGEYICSLGEAGTDTASVLDRPSSIGIDTNDNVYITEMINGRIIIYDSNDKYLHAFGKCGSGEGQYSGPQGICIVADDIYISDTYNNRIVIV